MSERPSDLLMRTLRNFHSLYGRLYDFDAAREAVRQEAERICALGKQKRIRTNPDPFDRDAEEYQNEKDPYA